MRVALVGTGVRGSSTWGKNLVHPYKDYVEMVALCDINFKRVEVAKKKQRQLQKPMKQKISI